MAGNLNGWEESQIKAIDKLIQKCWLRYYAFEREHVLLNQPAKFNMSEERKEHMSERLRYFATDLYSVLDYLCYFCHCHFKNNHQPSYSKEARNVKFPYKELKTSDVPAMETSCENKTEKFLSEHFNTIFGSPDDEASRLRYEDFKKFIRSFQVVTRVDGQGNPVLQNQQPEQTVNAKNFNILHYLRNTTVHRNLIDIAVENAWLYVNLQDGSHQISVEMPERIDDRRNWQSIRVVPGCWITLPSAGSNGLETKTLLSVLSELLKFVKTAVQNLLSIAFSDQIPEYHHDTVRTGLDDGVHIDPDGDRRNTVNYTWAQFEERCYIHEDNSYLWAV